MVLSKCCGLFFLIVALDHALECALEDTLEFALENMLELALQLELNYIASGCSLDAHWMCPANVGLRVYACFHSIIPGCLCGLSLLS